jgi:hypothetical protein
LITSAYWALVSLFCGSSRYHLISGTNRSPKGCRNGILGCIAIKEVGFLDQACLTGANKSYSSPEVRARLCSRSYSSNRPRRSFRSWRVTRKHFGGPQCHGCRSRHKPHRHRELCVSCNKLTTATFLLIEFQIISLTTNVMYQIWKRSRRSLRWSSRRQVTVLLRFT